MYIRDLNQCREFVAGDETLLREILHPEKQGLAIGYSLAHAVVSPGRKSRPHRLKTSEVYYILQGEGLMVIDGERAPVEAAQAVYIPPGSVQHIENTGPTELKFLCIVDPAWRAGDEEVL